jgi:hypothetical protein
VVEFQAHLKTQLQIMRLFILTKLMAEESHGAEIFLEGRRLLLLQMKQILIHEGMPRLKTIAPSA